MFRSWRLHIGPIALDNKKSYGATRFQSQVVEGKLENFVGKSIFTPRFPGALFSFVSLTTLTNTFLYISSRGQFWTPGIVVACVCVCVRLCVCVCQSRACQRDNLKPVQGRITKFGPDVQNTLVKIPIALWQLTLTSMIKFKIEVQILWMPSFHQNKYNHQSKYKCHLWLSPMLSVCLVLRSMITHLRGGGTRLHLHLGVGALHSRGVGGTLLQCIYYLVLYTDEQTLTTRLREGTSQHFEGILTSICWGWGDHNGVSNHQPGGCLLNRLFRRRSKKISNSASLAFVRGVHRDRWIPRTKGQ